MGLSSAEDTLQAANEILLRIVEAVVIIIIIIIFTGFPAGTVQIRGHEQLQQKISNLSILVASQMDITSYHFGRFEEPP